MKKNALIVFAAIFSLLFLFTACGAPANAPAGSSPAAPSAAKATTSPTPQAASSPNVFKYYKAVTLGMTQDEVGKATGLEAVAATGAYDPEGAFNYTGADGYGVYVLFNKDMKAYSKTVLKRDCAKDIAPLTAKPVTEAQCGQITEGMSHADVVKLLGGDGVELSATAVKTDTVENISPILYWANKDGSIIQVVFQSDGTVVNAMYFDQT